MIKIWEVDLGNSWSRKHISAATFEGAYRKARKLARDIPVGCGKGKITKINLEAETDE